MTQIFRKKPIEIEAIQWTGSNINEVMEFMNGGLTDGNRKWWQRSDELIIYTKEGSMEARIGDYIIKEPFDKERGFYPCKPDVFEKTYEIPSKYSPAVTGEEGDWIRQSYDLGFKLSEAKQTIVELQSRLKELELYKACYENTEGSKNAMYRHLQSRITQLQEGNRQAIGDTENDKT